MTVEAPPATTDDAAARPTTLLPRGQLIRLSLYWLGLSSVFIGLNNILGGRILFEGLGDEKFKATTLFILSVMGTVIAVLVQPTIGSISDYTVSRWGRRKPYIFIGSALDIVFLLGIASSNTVLAIAAFMALLQFSANFAQGPFQGYIPDLVPDKQVGLASALVGLFQVLGNAFGFAIGAVAVATGSFWLGTMALGVLEFVTMLAVVIRVDEGRTARPRDGKGWGAIGLEAWGTDILRERSFVWLVGSRWFVLMGMTMLTNFAIYYFVQSFGMTQEETGTPMLGVLAATVVGNLLAVLPAARISDRIGRKPVIYTACAVGSVGLAIVAAAPVVGVAVFGGLILGAGFGMFLAVDWALLTDLVPKASAGRYMGISNVATATAGLVGLAIGGIVIDVTNLTISEGIGPRIAIGLSVPLLGLGALLLHPVKEPGRAPRGIAPVAA
ncbi:MAG TPA: MFS transporter [Candidatus Limnocylindrales bacterium]|nr:MFS transporter [Candidatus Limnocylindrales bacterium]